MHADEAATVLGRIIDTAGDGIMAECPRVIGATECPVEIQTVMAGRPTVAACCFVSVSICET